MPHSIIRPPFARKLLAILALVLADLCAADIDTPVALKLPEQSLTQSIIDLGKASKTSIIVPSQLLSGLKAKEFRGKCTPRKVLNKLLKDTHLSFKEINSSVIAIIPRPSAEADHDQDIRPDQHEHLFLEELVIIGRQVTGSFLDRTDLQGSSPVDIITRHELDISGSQSVGDYLKFIPAVSGNSTSTAISNGGDGTATVTLRGLPANNTLVLLNGKRIAAEGLDGDSVDLNSIPSAAIERIEILKDGASAIYGTDAIAGVVNIIMKREYDGFQVEQYFGASSRNDLETSVTHALWGRSFDKGGLLISTQHFDQNGLFSRERTLSADADVRSRGGTNERSSASPTSQVSVNGEALILDENTPDDSRIEALPYRPITAEDGFNYFSQTSSISPSKRYSIFLSSHYQPSDFMTVGLEASFNETEATITLASTPLFTRFENTPITVAADNIYNPFGTEITDVRRRFLELPPREQINTTQAKRISLTLDGFSESTNWELNANWNRTDATEQVNHLLDNLRVLRALGPSRNCQGIGIDGCEPLNVFGPAGSVTQTQLDYIRSSNVIDGFTQVYSFNGIIGTELVELPAGPLDIATGFDLRGEEVDSRPLTNASNIGDSARSDTTGSRRIHEAFVEAQIPLIKHGPLIKSLDLDLALRHSRYDDFGNNTSPKFGFRYRPTSQLLIRSTYSEGFRAPNLGELNSGNFQSQPALTDPCSFEKNVGVLPGCRTQSDPNRIQILTTFGGEPTLRPETSTSYTMGIVWTPSFNNDLFVSVDQFSIQQENIVTANAQLILDRNAEFNEFQEFVIRDERGEILSLFSPFINIGRRKISGIDASVRYIVKTKQRGTINYSFNTSYLDEYGFKLDENADYEYLQGTFQDAANEGSGALPRWKANAGVFWAYDRFELSYSVNYISDMAEIIARTQNDERTVKRWTTHDVQISYHGGKRKQLKLTLGADNVWDQEPPFSSSAFNDNFDARTYDIRGQFIYGRLIYNY